MNFEFGLTLSILQKFKLGQLFAVKNALLQSQNSHFGTWIRIK